MREIHLTGLRYLEAGTELLRRNRSTHPTAGSFEAADLQWWWRTPRSTDGLPQLFWFDADDRPVAAVVATDWDDVTALDLLVLPEASAEEVERLLERGLAHARSFGFDRVRVEIDGDDDELQELLAGHGFWFDGPAVVEAWLAADDRPPIGPIAEGYRLQSRSGCRDAPHHMAGRSGPEVELRLRETSLYRADLDLFVLDDDDGVAAYGLFWFDPVTATGLVEPMRTEDGHRRRGLARHVLTTGLDRLARAGAERVKICYEQRNSAARLLYLDVGFRPVRETVMFSGRLDA